MLRSTLRMLACALCLYGGVNTPAMAAFGFTRSSDRIVVDTGAELVFSVNVNNGDIVSMRYRNNELQTTESKGSHIASGLGSASVEARVVGGAIVVSAKAGDLIQYYIARKGRSAIYMATYAPTLLPVGELRFIARLSVGKLPTAQQEPDSNVGTVIEGEDVFLLPDGRTSSKFYSARRMLDDQEHGVSGSDVAVFMLMGNREHSSGGPFFKDIATQKTRVTHELYNYMYSDHTQTEAFRGGLHGVYGLLFTDGGAPSSAQRSTDFIDATLGLSGYLASSGRGGVSGRVSGVLAGQPAVIGLRNAQAQYWATANGSGNYQIAGVRPGRYRMTLYQHELEVAQRDVEVFANATAQAALQATALPGTPTWQIGVADGTPGGFRHADLLPRAHPSDTRMRWTPLTYTVGSSNVGSFPAVQWRGINTPTRIDFTLAANAVRAYRLRIFVPLAQAGARPQVSVNARWNGPVPAAPTQPKTRGITRGTTRGNNTLYEVDIPAAALQTGTNRIEIGIASGSPDNGYLSPALVFDSIQLVAL
ncbi:rhamnogalacturonan lyase B N-terminal domain-containing protein [Xanthomonas floridensis]|uniref:rhamnogalacturonan endolyase n=1 Tax=Xanthomonas floridensis TaxID=1843580 RepID=A0A1A9M613_9XANT|nr:rhamnogalacturonan lyase B N-terminal domain-containing protein [Xanthomonas floridensis]MEA5122873.1 rhamnogalacturonan lyase B N-terminal domain-containing protein [Xanthomonas floridensis]MEA5130711.1 rhamnogalacturonan lyase B N-terminal domain-containing protein [Xanthomonas floridensis]OAG65924.1 rhamnogalacturonase B [Xanthomonas floridensis]